MVSEYNTSVLYSFCIDRKFKDAFSQALWSNTWHDYVIYFTFSYSILRESVLIILEGIMFDRVDRSLDIDMFRNDNSHYPILC